MDNSKVSVHEDVTPRKDKGVSTKKIVKNHKRSMSMGKASKKDSLHTPRGEQEKEIESVSENVVSLNAIATVNRLNLGDGVSSITDKGLQSAGGKTSKTED